MTKPFLPTYLYIKTHNITGLKYFGKTTKDPFDYHGSGTHWLSHLKKHGYNISTEVIGYFTVKEECIAVATKFSQDNNIVNALNEDKKKIWANQIIENGLDGGITRVNFTHSNETKKKIGASHKGKKISPNAIQKRENTRRENNSYRKKGEWNFPESSKQKLRDANLGKKQSTETKQKRSQALKGHVVTEETKQKLRDANLGKKMSEEAIQKMRNKVVSEEQKQRLREINLGKKVSEETKKKLSGKVVVVDKIGNLLRIDKEQYYSQTGTKETWEWVFHKSKEAQGRRG
jgi:hypothetical protein